MRTIVGIAIVITLASAVAFAGAVISKFEAEPGNNKVILRWTTTAESNLKGFEIERSAGNMNFQRVGFVEAVGNSSSPQDYTFEDKSVFKPTGNTYKYRLKLVDRNGTFTYYDKIVTVTPQISTTRHTWGSIKAMFR